MAIEEIIGNLAATLTTISFLPQVIKTVRSGSAEGVSLAMYAIFVIGILLWLAYGLMLNNTPIIAANSVTAVLAGIVLGIKLKEVLRKP